MVLLSGYQSGSWAQLYSQCQLVSSGRKKPRRSGGTHNFKERRNNLNHGISAVPPLSCSAFGWSIPAEAGNPFVHPGKHVGLILRKLHH